jgi:hypothetical protein
MQDFGSCDLLLRCHWSYAYEATLHWPKTISELEKK